ncbi:MAG: class I SAM-dependent methyltransferase, partial [Chloroflexota bacterium]|nr:class I SAM-dependent methyltransferase [Chloroflexota bacterium]MEC9288457.1 class I SAM-dependent methyltransferase [Chloroflexota bacterium]
AKAKLNFHEMTPEQEETVYRGLHPTNLATGRILPTRYDFSAYLTLLDLGGGSGGLAIGVTEESSHPRHCGGLPEVLAIAQRSIAETRANDRVSVMAADVLSGSINGPFDVVVMCNFIQGFSQDEARRAIKNVIKAVEPGGKLYIVGRVLDDDHLSPASALNNNLFFLNIYDGGQAHTERQHLERLTDAGFESI